MGMFDNERPIPEGGPKAGDWVCCHWHHYMAAEAKALESIEDCELDHPHCTICGYDLDPVVSVDHNGYI